MGRNLLGGWGLAGLCVHTALCCVIRTVFSSGLSVLCVFTAFCCAFIASCYVIIAFCSKYRFLNVLWNTTAL